MLTTVWPIFLGLAGFLLASVMCLIVLPLIPGAIESLTNKPNFYRPEGVNTLSYQPSKFGFFTYLQPGRVKIIERGERFIRCIMAFDGHMFLGESSDNLLEPEHADYWKVVKTPKELPDSHPIPFPTWKAPWWWILYSPVSIFWWAWKRYVFWLTGAVFTGITSFQNVRTYPLEHFKRVTDGEGKSTLERVHNYSDHYRVADFQYPVVIPSADTKDKIAVSVALNEVAKVLNPYMVAYNTDDDWTTRFLASISNGVTVYTRSHSLDEVLSAKDAETAAELSKHVGKVTQEAVKAFGLHVARTEVLDITPTDAAIATKLGDLAVARVDKEADEQRAIGKAAYIRQEGQALKDFPKADIVVQAEAMVKAAEAAGKNGGIVVLGGQSIDPMQAAILKELRRPGSRAS